MRTTSSPRCVRLGSAKTLTKLGSGMTTEQQILPALIFQP